MFAHVVFWAFCRSSLIAVKETVVLLIISSIRITIFCSSSPTHSLCFFVTFFPLKALSKLMCVFSFENAYILISLGHPSTLIRRAHRFEYALESIVLVRTRDDAISVTAKTDKFQNALLGQRLSFTGTIFFTLQKQIGLDSCYKSFMANSYKKIIEINIILLQKCMCQAVFLKEESNELGCKNNGFQIGSTVMYKLALIRP